MPDNDAVFIFKLSNDDYIKNPSTENNDKFTKSISLENLKEIPQPIKNYKKIWATVQLQRQICIQPSIQFYCRNGKYYFYQKCI